MAEQGSGRRLTWNGGARLRVGVIGLGTGRRHVDGYRQHPAAEMVAAADLDTGRRALAKVLRIPEIYETGEELLERAAVDVVSIATPNDTHKPLTLAALDAGCHVLCEKPLATNGHDAQQMVEAATRARKRLMMNMAYRFNAGSQLLKQEIEAGKLGHISLARSVWHRRGRPPESKAWFQQKHKSGGGPLIDLGVHRIDLPLWLLGFPQPECVLASASTTMSGDPNRIGCDVEDLAVAAVRFENAVTLFVETSWSAPIAEQEVIEMRLQGNLGCAGQRNLAQSFDQFETAVFSEASGKGKQRRIVTTQAPADSGMVHFIERIVAEQPHMASGEEGVAVLKIIDAIYQSAACGGPVALTATV